MNIKFYLKAVGGVLKAKAPAICLAGGIFATGKAVVAAYKSHDEIEERIEHHIEKFEVLKKAKESEHPENFKLGDEVYQPEKHKEYKIGQTMRAGKDILWASRKVIFWLTLAVTLFIFSFCVLNKRLKITAAALSSVTAAYEKLSENVKYEYGEQKWRELRYGDSKKAAEAKTPEEVAEYKDPFRSYSKDDKFTIMYDENTADIPRDSYRDNPIQNVIELNQGFRMANSELTMKQRITFNRLCELLNTPSLKKDEGDFIRYFYGTDVIDPGPEFRNLVDKINHTSPNKQPKEWAELMAECNRGFIFEFVPKDPTASKKINWRYA